MKDWEDFRVDVPWGAPKGIVSVGPESQPSKGGFQPSQKFQERYPALTVLLSLARVTPIRTRAREYQLLGWTARDGRTLGWLSPTPKPGVVKPELHEDHRTLLHGFGGILHRWNEPDETWLLNLNSALTEDESGIGLGDWYPYYLKRCEKEQRLGTVQSQDYVTFAYEANGNLTLYHRGTSDVLMFAPDHAYDHIEALEGAPEYTLYRIRNCSKLVDWVEAVATQWAQAIGLATT